MNSIKINYQETDEDRFGKSKFWGQPDLPEFKVDGMKLTVTEVSKE